MNKMGLGLLVAAITVGGAGVAAAQDEPQLVDRVAKAFPANQHEAPACDLKPGHFRVSSISTYMKSASEANDPVRRGQLLGNAKRAAVEALEAGLTDNPAAWYYLGRTYILQGDIAGADSAFTRVEEMRPDCAEDTKAFRQRAWLPLVNAASEMLNKGQEDSALAVFRQAAAISRAYPQGFYNTAILFSNRGENDSAAHYFRVARDIAAKDPSFSRDRNSATISLAAILQQGQKHDEAIVELRQYLQWAPNDVEAKRGLAASLRATGKTEEASQIDQELLAAAQASGNLSVGDLFSMGVSFFNDSKYQEAAEAFGKIHAMEPHNYDALANLANAYYAMQDGPKVVEYAGKLIEIEPLNEDNHKLLIQGERLAGNDAGFEAAAEKFFVLPTAISLGAASVDGGTVKVAGQAIGRRDAMDMKTGKEVPPAAVSIVFEFLDGEGQVVASQEITIPALEPDATSDFTAEGTADGIRAWRYRVK